MKMLRNKRGTDKIISVYWFAILFIVAVAVVYMVSVFYGGAYDVREFEANAMINQIADCITDGSNLKSIANEEFMSVCNLDFGDEVNEYYFEVLNDGTPIVNQGDVNLKEYCGKEGKKLPKCVVRKLYLPNNLIEIQVVINKVNKNA